MGTSSLILPSSLTGGSSAPTAIVMGTDNLPVPPTEICERLARIHPALGLRFADGLAGSGWSVIWKWQPDDRRWAFVQNQSADPAMAFDVIGYLPFGCSVDQAPSYIERSFKQYPREEVSRLAGRMSHWNTVAVPAQQHEAAMTGTMDDIARDQRAPKAQVVSVPSGPVKSKRSGRA